MPRYALFIGLVERLLVGTLSASQVAVAQTFVVESGLRPALFRSHPCILDNPSLYAEKKDQPAFYNGGSATGRCKTKRSNVRAFTC